MSRERGPPVLKPTIIGTSFGTGSCHREGETALEAWNCWNKPRLKPTLVLAFQIQRLLPSLYHLN